MRLLRNILILLACICLLAMPVGAAPAASSAEASAAVDTDGRARISLRLQLHLEEAERLQFWFPADAEEIRVAGRYRTPEADGGRLRVTLQKMGSGVHTVDVSFELPCALEKSDGKLYLVLPLLSGMPYPIENFQFSVSLPGEIRNPPVFSSGYYGEAVASRLTVTTQGGQITGKAAEPLLDRETLSLRLEADLEMFPDYKEKTGLFDPWQTAMLVLMALAAVYYLAVMPPMLPRRIRSSEPPDGLAAGELGTCLTGCGMDLTMMVFSWAQLGYLRIRADSRGRVLLLRGMDMGNERSERENRCFRALFSQRDTVDGGGLHYARLCRKMAASSPLTRQIYRSTTGNPRIVRALAAAAGVCSGVEMSLRVYTAGAGTVFLALGMALLCGALSYLIQAGGRCLPLGNKRPLWISLLCVGLWILVGLLCGALVPAGAMAVYQLLTGLAAAVGGRRSQLGQQYVAQIRGLRAHLTRASVFDMQQNLQRNPDYFFDRMPYALALGVEKPFARRFGKKKLQPCSFLELPKEREMTAAQWAVVLRRTADRLNRRQRSLRYERLLRQAEQIVRSK